MPFIRNEDGSLEMTPDVDAVLRKYPHNVIRNLKGEIVRSNLNENFEPKSFADYHLYVFEHAFIGDIEQSVMVLSFMPEEPSPCGVCGMPTTEIYPEPLQDYKPKEEVIIYAICEECWEDTHLAHLIGEESEGH